MFNSQIQTIEVPYVAPATKIKKQLVFGIIAISVIFLNFITPAPIESSYHSSSAKTRNQSIGNHLEGKSTSIHSRDMQKAQLSSFN